MSCPAGVHAPEEQTACAVCFQKLERLKTAANAEKADDSEIFEVDLAKLKDIGAKSRAAGYAACQADVVAMFRGAGPEWADVIQMLERGEHVGAAKVKP